MTANKSDGLKLILLRNEFYRDNYRRAWVALIMVIAINIILALMVFYKVTFPPTPVYFATTAAGQIIMMHPLTDPVVPDDMLLPWAAGAVQKVFNLDYIHWRAQLDQAQENFTQEGWKWFIASLKSTNNLKTLQALQMVSSAKLTGSPTIMRKGIVDGHFAWNIKMPLLVTYRGNTHTIQTPMNVTIIVLREPTSYFPNRVAINNFFVQTLNPTPEG